MKRSFLFFLSLALFIPIVFAAEEKGFISVRAEIDKGSITIGEKVEYRVTVTHDADVQIVSQILPPNTEPFEVKKAQDFSEKQGKEIAEGRRFTLTAYELGEFILEPVTIQYRVKGSEPKTLQTNRLFVTVRSVDANKPKTDIRTVKGMMGLKRVWTWLWVLLGLLAAGGLGAWWRARCKKLMEEAAKEPDLSPEDEALLKLSRLYDSNLLRKGKVKEYFLELSEILKRYFEKRFEIAALESTTSEILRDLKRKEIENSLSVKIQTVLETADLVKFAKWNLSPVEIIKTHQMAKALVEEARPKVIVSPETEMETNARGI